MSKIKGFNPSTPDAQYLEPIKEIEVETSNTLVQENYEAEEWLSWFMSDTQNVQNWAGGIFRGGFDKTDPRLATLIAAAEKSLSETADDVEKLKEFIEQYKPNT